MRQLVLTALIVLALSLPVRANDAAQKVISDQIAAFLEDDVETAFTFASPAIRRVFGTPERFGQMVRQGYPMVWRPADMRFLATEERSGALVQTVLIRDAAGALHVLEYRMIETDGGLRIDAVRLIEQTPGTA